MTWSIEVTADRLQEVDCAHSSHLIYAHTCIQQIKNQDGRDKHVLTTTPPLFISQTTHYIQFSFISTHACLKKNCMLELFLYRRIP